MAGPIGNVKVEIAWDSGFSTLEGSRTWTDVTTDVWAAEGIGITYGRTDQQTSADPNALSLTLKNDAGKYTPGNTGSPYYPNVKKGRPVRVSTTYGGTTKVRYTGYVNEWPVVWPDGSDRSSTVTITASSRRARLGQTAPLTSAIRAAYLATSPTAYWPMDEDYGDIAQYPDKLLFRDVSNLVDNPDPRKREYITTWWTAAALQPTVHDGTTGPADEQSLVKVPAFTNPALLGTFSHYVGGGQVVTANTAGGYVTVEVVARVAPLERGDTSITFINLFSPDLINLISLTAVDEDNLGFGSAVAGSILVRDPSTRVLLENQGAGSLTAYPTATDGNIHHYAFVLDSAGTVGRIYFDGTLIGTLAIANAMTQRMTQIVMADDTYQANVWVGHAAVHDRALTDAEVLAHAQAATASTETTATRVTRVAGRVGVPAAEVDAETTVASGLGAQSEAGRSAVEVLDELAAATGGILYDTRAGHLAMQARNHRYNQTPAFTLDTASEELEVDLTVLLDAQYLVNSVDVSSSTGDAPVTLTDTTSISDYGVYSKSLQVAAVSFEEGVSAGRDQLFRYATPRTRISQVSVDVGDLTSAQRNLVLNADIGTLFNVTGLPSQAPATTMALYVEGYAESIGKDAHIITFNTTPGDLYTNVAVLDDAAHDVLGSGIVLAY